MYFEGTSANNYVKIDCPEICNITISNESLVNSIDISTNGNNIDIGTLSPNRDLTEDQNRFQTTSGSIYVKSSVPNSPANFKVYGW